MCQILLKSVKGKWVKFNEPDFTLKIATFRGRICALNLNGATIEVSPFQQKNNLLQFTNNGVLA